MKCSEDNKAFKAAVKKAYELGIFHGENHLQKTINKILSNNTTLLNANQILAKELLRLNNVYPLKDTPSIIIPLNKAKSILGALREKSDAYKYFQKVLGEQMCSVS